MIAASLADGTLAIKQGDKFHSTNITMLSFLKGEKFKIDNSITNPIFKAPLSEAFGFLDGSAYLNHVELARKARGASLPKDLYEVPLMYQGLSSPLLGPTDPVPLRNYEWGLDFEAEIGVVTEEVPEGVTENEALKHIKFFCMLNDWTYRNLLPREAETGFGFIQSKPASSFAPFFISPDELDVRDGKLFSNVKVFRSGEQFGELQTSEMHFSFGALIAHAAKTRTLPAGTIIGSGTISNKNGNGFGCIVEKRSVETISGTQLLTPYLNVGEEIVISSQHFGEIRNVII